MSALPEGWPPAGDSGAASERRVAPLFALPNVFLFPGCVMPLHVFEPRYRQMVEDLLDGPGRFVLGTVLEEHAGDLTGSPPVHDVAGLGEIVQHEKLPDGRFLIWVFGLRRVALRETGSERLYRKVTFTPLNEVEVPSEYARSLDERLRKAILARCKDLLNLPDDMPIGSLADLLLQRMSLPQSVMQRIYSEIVIAQRAEDALDEHERRPAEG